MNVKVKPVDNRFRTEQEPFPPMIIAKFQRWEVWNNYYAGRKDMRSKTTFIQLYPKSYVMQQISLQWRSPVQKGILIQFMLTNSKSIFLWESETMTDTKSKELIKLKSGLQSLRIRYYIYTILYLSIYLTGANSVNVDDQWMCPPWRSNACSTSGLCYQHSDMTIVLHVEIDSFSFFDEDAQVLSHQNGATKENIRKENNI